MRSNYGFSVSGIPLFALYLFNRFYARDLSVEELLHLAVYSITETASQDGKVGGAIQALEITAKEAKELTKEEIEKIIESNNGRSTRLKKSFYHEGGGNHAGKETTRTAKK